MEFWGLRLPGCERPDGLELPTEKTVAEALSPKRFECPGKDGAKGKAPGNAEGANGSELHSKRGQISTVQKSPSLDFANGLERLRLPALGKVAGEDGPVESLTHGDPEPVRNQNNHRITDADQLGSGSLKRKCEDNLAAIELLKRLEGEGRPATDYEKRVLVRYVGWGGLPQVFDAWNEDWKEQRERLEHATMPVRTDWPVATPVIQYDAIAANTSPANNSPKTANPVVELRHERGNWATKHDLSSAISQERYGVSSAGSTMSKKFVTGTRKP